MSVSVIPCADYDQPRVDAALSQAIQAIGGLDWVKPGMTVAVKANLVSFLKPDAAATTHPAVLIALTRLLKERGAEVIVGDSPGGVFTPAFVGTVYAATGMRALEACGAKLNDDFGIREVDFPEARAAHRFTCTEWLLKADAIINVCKLKTHGLMGMSAAVKNLFGAIPGTMKPEYHYRFPNETAFSDMLIDLNEYFRPKLCVCDAIVGMEGNGPTKGRPRTIGALLASQSPYELDLIGAKLIGLTCSDVPTLSAAAKYGLAPDSADTVEVAGNINALCLKDFDNIATRGGVDFSGSGNALSGKLLGFLLAGRPKVKPDECVGCAQCAKLCPAKAITMRKKLPSIDRKKCIRCFCCQEFCPKGAMKVHRLISSKLIR